MLSSEIKKHITHFKISVSKKTKENNHKFIKKKNTHNITKFTISKRKNINISKKKLYIYISNFQNSIISFFS